MRTGAKPLQFDIEFALHEVARAADSRLGAMQLSLPFLTALVHPTLAETKVAAEILLRANDRRVLSAWECCDGCIDDALSSLQQFRGELVSKQIELVGASGALSGLLELMLAPIRQFLTFEQRLSVSAPQKRVGRDEHYRDPKVRQTYFDALEQLRGHLSQCLGQIAIIAGTTLPADRLIASYQGPWPLDAYALINMPKVSP